MQDVKEERWKGNVVKGLEIKTLRLAYIVIMLDSGMDFYSEIWMWTRLFNPCIWIYIKKCGLHFEERLLDLH